MISGWLKRRAASLASIKVLPTSCIPVTSHVHARLCMHGVSVTLRSACSPVYAWVSVTLRSPSPNGRIVNHDAHRR